MRKKFLACLASVITAIGVPATHADSLSVSPKSIEVASGIPWVPFHWSTADIEGRHLPKYALMVPVQIRDQTDTYYMQLDTGTSETIFYAVPDPVKKALLGDYSGSGPFYLPLHVAGNAVTMSGIKIKYSPVASIEGDHLQIGTIGQDMVLSRVILIDFVHQRIAFLKKEDVKPSYLNGVSFVPMHYRNDQLFIPLKLDGTAYLDDFFYDSGSSMFTLLTTSVVWQQATRSTVHNSENDVLHVTQWGSIATLLGARLTGHLSIGPVEIDSPMIYFQQSGGSASANLANAHYPVKGLIGNAAFYDCCMVVLDAPDDRFGIESIATR